MAIPQLNDEDVRRNLPIPVAVDVMEQAFALHAAGSLIAPARTPVDLQVGRLVFTTGAVTEQGPCLGFRVYDISQLHSPNRGELTVVFDPDGGALKGIVTGPLLGAVRTGAIGGVAVKYAARPDAKSLSILGTGFQAHTQLRAALTVREFTTVRIFSRSADNRNAFAQQAAEYTDAEILVCNTAREAVENADVLICATVSRDPLFEAAWLPPGAHVSTIGPKFHSGSELDPQLASRASLIFTDSPAQAAAIGEDFILAGSDDYQRMISLSDIVSGKQPARSSSEDITLFYSLGLAGTEVLLADRLLMRLED